MQVRPVGPQCPLNLDNCIVGRRQFRQVEFFVQGNGFSQATKGLRWMPWHRQPKKGVASDEMLRGAAGKRRSGDSRMGKPGAEQAASSQGEHIALWRGSGGTETS